MPQSQSVFKPPPFHKTHTPVSVRSRRLYIGAALLHCMNRPKRSGAFELGWKEETADPSTQPTVRVMFWKKNDISTCLLRLRQDPFVLCCAASGCGEGMPRRSRYGTAERLVECTGKKRRNNGCLTAGPQKVPYKSRTFQYQSTAVLNIAGMQNSFTSQGVSNQWCTDCIF